VPVIIGAAIGAYAGASIQSGTVNPTQWHSDAWKGAIVGGIVGAGLGLGFSYGLAATGAKVTKISASGAKGAAGLTGAHTASWNIASNALITGNINIASSYAQGRGVDGAYKSGLVGLGAGAIGGAAGHYASGAARAKSYAMSAKSIKTQNYVTAGFNGFGDRMTVSYDRGARGWDLWRNGLLGAGEGLLAANLVNNNIFFNSDKLITTGNFATNSTTGGQYLSSFITQSLTSVPGAGYTAYTYYAMAGWGMALNKSIGPVGYGIGFVSHPAFPMITNSVMGDYPALIRPYSFWDLFGL
jgi:hypothetical protein